MTKKHINYVNQNNVKHNLSSLKPPNQCTHYGAKGHLAKDCRRSQYSTCNKCGKKGHFSSMCFSKSDSMNNNSQISLLNQHRFTNQNRSGNRQQYPQRQNKHNQKYHVNQAEVDENSDEDIYAFQLGKQNSTYPIEINNTTTNIIDSRSTINIIDETAFKNISPKPQIVSTKT